MGNQFPTSFFAAFDTITLAKKLLGCELVSESSDGITAGIIVETEAYLQNDPACHAYNRRTARTKPMYAQAGTTYVYLIYGMYQCFNVVSNSPDIGEAVLIRALQPTQGAELMQYRRAKTGATESRPIIERELCRGPGKLVKALGIERSQHNHLLLPTPQLYINEPVTQQFEIVETTRIGIKAGAELPFRFYIKDNRYVSRF